jgi:outer membrane protein assembly factor BamD (BamD/ComL family)
MKTMRMAAALAAFLALGGAAQAAADWQWTKGQGWTEGAGSPRATAAEQLKHAYGLEKKGEFLDAAKQYFLLLRAYSDAPEAGIALQRLAKCLFEMENYYQAFQAIEQVIESYPQSAQQADLLAIEMKIAQKLQAGARPSILRGEEDGAVAGRKAAVEVYKAILKHDAYGPLADDVLLSLGETFLSLQDPRQAREQFSRLLNEFSKSPLVDRARLGLTRCDVLDGKASTSDVQRTIKEIQSKEKTESKTPGEDAKLEQSMTELEELEAEKMWTASEFYLRRGTPESVGSAVWTLNELIRRFPKTVYAQKARELVPQIKVPKKGSGPVDLTRLNIPIISDKKKKKEKASFVTPQLDGTKVKTEPVTEPIPGIRPQAESESTAGAQPMAPTPVASGAAPDEVPGIRLPKAERAAPSPDADASEAGALSAIQSPPNVEPKERKPVAAKKAPLGAAASPPAGKAGGWTVDIDDAPSTALANPAEAEPAAQDLPAPEIDTPASPAVDSGSSEAHAVPAMRKKKKK